jgi:hypothetical protein
VNEATLRAFFRGTVSLDHLAAELRGAGEPLSGTGRQGAIQGVSSDEDVTITAAMLVRLCDAVLAGDLPAPALETVALAAVASDRLHWREDDELVGRVLYDWASPGIGWGLSSGSIRMFRDWLTGEAQPPSEPDISADTLLALGFPRRASRIQAPKQDLDRTRSEEPRDG